jgi:hypothetical protein
LKYEARAKLPLPAKGSKRGPFKSIAEKNTSKILVGNLAGYMYKA